MLLVKKSKNLHNNTDQQFSANQHHCEYGEPNEHATCSDHISLYPSVSIVTTNYKQTITKH